MILYFTTDLSGKFGGMGLIEGGEFVRRVSPVTENNSPVGKTFVYDMSSYFQLLVCNSASQKYDTLREAFKTKKL